MEEKLKFTLTCVRCDQIILREVPFDQILQSESKVREHECQAAVSDQRKHWWAENSRSSGDEHIG